MANSGGGICGSKPTLGPPVTVTTVVPDGGTCDAVGPSDGEGNWVVATSETQGTLPFATEVWHSHRSDGSSLADRNFFPVGLDGFMGPPLASGWFEVEFTGNFQADTLVLPYSATLQARSDHFDPRYFFGYPDHNIAPAPGGGMAGVGPPQAPGPTCTGEDFPVRIARYDAMAAVTASANLGCVKPGSLSALAVNVSGDVVLLSGTQGWTLHSTGELTSFLFPPGNASLLFALADGRFAVKNDLNQWEATVSAEGVLSPPPCWLITRSGVTSIQLVQGGNAYLLRYESSSEGGSTDCDHYLEYVLANGTGCGFVPVRGARTCTVPHVAVGVDGTLTTLDDAACTVSAWPAAFGPGP